MKKSNLRRDNIIQLLLTLVIAVLLVFISSHIYYRVDLTSEKRYSLSVSTRQILNELASPVFVQIYLDGEMPVGFKKLRRSVKDMLDEFRIQSGKKVIYEFIDPFDFNSQEEKKEMMETLYEKGLQPINIHDRDEEGGVSQKMVFPGMIMNYNGMEMTVNILENNPAQSPAQNLNNSIEGLEYKMIQVIQNLSADTIYNIAFLEGHGELDEFSVGDITYELAKYYNVDRGVMGGKLNILDKYAALIIAKPELRFSEADKFVIDQYIMNGGRVLWLLDAVEVRSDSLQSAGSTAGLYRPLNLVDQLFKYGVRVNPKIVQDQQCSIIPINIALVGQQPRFSPVPWIYFPLLTPFNNHPVTKNLNLIKSEYINTLDTVGAIPGIKKNYLLYTSKFSRLISPPVRISLEELKNPPAPKEFNVSHLPVAILLEGSFESVFKNRPTDRYIGEMKYQIIEKSVPTKMIVVADGDIIRNEVRHTATRDIPLPLGQDRYTKQIYGNKDFILNSVNYLIDDINLMNIRSKELKLRLLNKERIKKEQFKWKLINVVFPVIFIIIFGVLVVLIRKRKYTRVGV
ncbi:MAG: gliding motility-associated ABC transporter substrate-binding protein GldG [Bacteroidetes bacterium]|nr:gliding motility-associated ABC transporter substrate-binding protein GldG [Bacteroidota bacterium]